MPLARYNQKLKITAKKLRTRGLSYKEIGARLNVSKSAARIWSKDVILKKKLKDKLYQKKISLITSGKFSSRERRKRQVEDIIKLAEGEINLPISYDTFRFFGAAIYWAEGSKTKIFAITNSDPKLIVFMVKWIDKVLGIGPGKIKAQLNIHEEQNENEIKKYWSKITGIPLINFGKTFIKPAGKNYRKNKLYFGTIRIRILKGTDFRYRLFGWIDTLIKNEKYITHP
jgi:hypothetical protein